MHDFVFLGQQIFVLEAELPVTHLGGIPFRKRDQPLMSPWPVDEELGERVDTHCERYVRGRKESSVSPAVRGSEGAEKGELVIAYDLDFDM